MKISKRIIRIINFQSFISDLFFHICLFTFAFLLLTSCETTEPPPSNQKLTLAAEDANCTEAWLNLKLDNVSLPTEIELKQNDSAIITTNINSNDTTLFIENLLPSQTYTFQTCIQNPASGIKKSNKVTVTTMDTTSHNFTWETFTFGGGGNSILRDVAIINENNIWAVGEIHTEDTDKFDSNGVWVQPYNAVHWDGNTWELKRILFYIDPFQPGAGRTVSKAISVFSFNENDFVVSSNAQIAFFNIEGNYVVKKMDFKWENLFTINSIWGTSSKNFYVVGNGGNIVHYNGSSWQKIESGTEIGILDICGNDKDEIYAIGTEYNTGESILLKIENKRAEKIIESSYHADLSNLFKTELYGMLGSVWTSDNGYMIIAGHYIYNHFKNKWSYAKGVQKNYVGSGQVIHRGYIHSICGTAVNDWFITGEYGTIQHFNGVASIQVGEPFNYQNTNDWYGSDAKNNLVCIVGQYENKGRIHIGKK